MFASQDKNVSESLKAHTKGGFLERGTANKTTEWIRCILAPCSNAFLRFSKYSPWKAERQMMKKGANVQINMHYVTNNLHLNPVNVTPLDIIKIWLSVWFDRKHERVIKGL